MSAEQHLSPDQFRSAYLPSEYGADWDSVQKHASGSNCSGIREFDAYGRGLNEQLRSSVKEGGIHTPVQVYQGFVVDGHHRVAAALSSGVQIPVEEAPSEAYEGQIENAPVNRR